MCLLRLSLSRCPSCFLTCDEQCCAVRSRGERESGDCPNRKTTRLNQETAHRSHYRESLYRTSVVDACCLHLCLVAGVSVASEQAKEVERWEGKRAGDSFLVSSSPPFLRLPPVFPLLSVLPACVCLCLSLSLSLSLSRVESDLVSGSLCVHSGRDSYASIE